MKGKSQQRFIITLILVLGFFGTLGFVIDRGLDKYVESMIVALTGALSLAIGMWFHQAGNEAREAKKPEPPNVP